MNQIAWTRAAALYLPLTAAALAGLTKQRRPRRFAAILLSFLWASTTLLVLQRMNSIFGWWTFSAPGVAICGMPLELYLGWSILWGVVPHLAFSRMRIAVVMAVMFAVDLAGMPLCAALVQLKASWLVGEAMALGVALLPAICIARWTENDERVRMRAAMQVCTAGMLFLFLIPEVVFAVHPGAGWTPLLRLRGWRLQLVVQVLFLLALPGVAAVMEFATRGGGTPMPYDPPKRLVTSGIYRYIANPMQLCCALVMICWATLLKDGRLALAAGMSLIYSAGIAEWDEREDLMGRFGAEWQAYRTAVRNWLPRWRPYHAPPASRLYIAASCGPCGELRAWLETRRPVGLELIDAETLPGGSIRRIRYVPADGSDPVNGVRALARALEHLNLGWALAGAAMQLPVVWQGVQLVMDAAGLGPRNIGERNVGHGNIEGRLLLRHDTHERSVDAS